MNLSCINDGDIPKYDLVNGSWYCDAETGLSASQVVAAVEGASSLNLPSGTQAGGSQVLTTGSTVTWSQLDASTIPSGLSDGDDVLNESEVETMVTNEAIDLATSSTVNGEMITTTPPACQDGQILSYDAASGLWNCIDFSNIIDQDGDGILAWNDCSDSDATLLAIADDADCDGIETSDDCDDNNNLSTAISDDADCDGMKLQRTTVMTPMRTLRLQEPGPPPPVLQAPVLRFAQNTPQVLMVFIGLRQMEVLLTKPIVI